MSKKLSIKPVGDRVLVEVEEGRKEEKTKGGLILPGTAEKERADRGKVIAVGEGWHNQEGKVFPLKVKKGQTVIFSKYGPDEIELDGRKYFLISESNILAVIE